MDIEDQLRNRVNSTWAAFQSAKGESKQALDAFRDYCNALNEAGRYAAEQVHLARDGQRGSAMRVALRVLAAINERQTPHAADVRSLRTFVPNAGDRAADDLACEVIQQEMRRRTKTRSAGT